MTTRRRVAGAMLCLGLCLGVLGAGLTACADQQTATEPARTSSPRPAVCQNVEAVRESMTRLREVKIGQNALPALSAELKTMRAELEQLPANASMEYSTQVEAVRSAAAALDSSITAATRSPSVTAVAAVADDVRALGAAVGTLSDAVGDTC